jgi:hypothetical protein
MNRERGGGLTLPRSLSVVRVTRGEPAEPAASSASASSSSTSSSLLRATSFWGRAGVSSSATLAFFSESWPRKPYKGLKVGQLQRLEPASSYQQRLEEGKSHGRLAKVKRSKVRGSDLQGADSLLADVCCPSVHPAT